VVDAGVPPIALVDWEDGETLVAAADGASGLVRPEPPVPVEQLIFRGVSASVKLGGDGVILWEPRPGGRESGCQPVDRGWPEYALTDLDDQPLGRCATVDGLFDRPEPQPRPWRLLGAQPSGPLAVALDRPTTDQSHLNRYFPGLGTAAQPCGYGLHVGLCRTPSWAELHCQDPCQPNLDETRTLRDRVQGRRSRLRVWFRRSRRTH
jgi:hypothetical protein